MNDPLLLRCLGDGDVLRNVGLRILEDPRRYLRYHRTLFKPPIDPSNAHHVTTALLPRITGHHRPTPRTGTQLHSPQAWTTNKGEGSHQTFP